MSTTKKPAGKGAEDLQTVLQNLIAQGQKDGMIRADELNSHLEKLDLTPEKIEEIYDRFEAMNIQILSAELELGDDLDLQDDVDDGDIAAVVLNDEATLKRVYHIKNGLQLLSENPKYPPMIFTLDECDSIRILGKAVGFQSRF